MAKSKAKRKEITISEMKPISFRGSMQARYDVNRTTTNDVNHWKNADNLSPTQENRRAVRELLVRRARYEVYNNCYGLGIVWSVVESVIGTGVRLHFDSGDLKIDELLSEMWEEHSCEMNLTDKLSLMQFSEIVDGESFPLFQTNPVLETPSKLDMILIPTERVRSPHGDFDASQLGQINNVDGIHYDDYQNITKMTILKMHPSDVGLSSLENISVDVPEKFICHYFLVKRIDEKRQVPRVTPALPLFAQLRRYTLAVLDTAETAANIAGVISSNASADGEIADVKAMDEVEIPKRALLTLPEGWSMSQLKAEQPTTTYKEFKNEILMEAVRCILMPRNVAKGDSSEYNYASGRLDKQQWEKSIGIFRDRIERIVLKKFVKLWLDELEFIVPKLKGKRKTMKIEMFWDGEYHVDPVKEATADLQNLLNKTTTLKDICARDGKDWRKVLKQAAIEKQMMVDLNLVIDDVLMAKKQMQISEQAAKQSAKQGQNNAKATK